MDRGRFRKPIRAKACVGSNPTASARKISRYGVMVTCWFWEPVSKVQVLLPRPRETSCRITDTSIIQTDALKWAIPVSDRCSLLKISGTSCRLRILLLRTWPTPGHANRTRTLQCCEN